MHCADIYDDLLKLFNVEDANRLMTVAVDSVSSYQHEFLQYGAAATIYVHCADIYDDLLKLFNVEDANRLMTVASLRVTNPGIACNRYQSKASISFISEYYPCIGLSSTNPGIACNRYQSKASISFISEYYPCIGLSSSSISTFIDNLGKQTSVLKCFYSLRFQHVTEAQNEVSSFAIKASLLAILKTCLKPTRLYTTYRR